MNCFGKNPDVFNNKLLNKSKTLPYENFIYIISPILCVLSIPVCLSVRKLNDMFG